MFTSESQEIPAQLFQNTQVTNNGDNNNANSPETACSDKTAAPLDSPLVTSASSETNVLHPPKMESDCVENQPARTIASSFASAQTQSFTAAI